MVSLARTSNDAHRRVLICSIQTECVPLREMLSLLLARRHIEHRTLESLPRLLEFLRSMSDAEDRLRLVVMVGPGLGSTEIGQLDAVLVDLRCEVALIAFDDAMDDPASWDGARVVPCLRSPIPPRFGDVLPVVDPPRS